MYSRAGRVALAKDGLSGLQKTQRSKRVKAGKVTEGCCGGGGEGEGRTHLLYPHPYHFPPKALGSLAPLLTSWTPIPMFPWG